jgi:hypothetical protein
MPRIMSIARRRPVRSSNVKRSDPVAGSTSGAVSVAISPFPMFSARSGSSVSTPPHPAPEGGIAALRVTASAAKVTGAHTLSAVRRSESLWLSRLRWRMRGAWLWPAFFGLTLFDGIVIWRLPPYEGAPPGLVGGILLAGFANLLLIALIAPLVGRRLRRVRQDLPRVVAVDYAGTALLAMLAIVVVAAGLVHRPVIAAEEDARAAAVAAVRDRVRLAEPEFALGLGAEDVLRLEPESYRVCVPGPDPERWLCHIVDVDRDPPRIVRDDSMEPNSALRTVGGFD